MLNRFSSGRRSLDCGVGATWHCFLRSQVLSKTVTRSWEEKLHTRKLKPSNTNAALSRQAPQLQ